MKNTTRRKLNPEGNRKITNMAQYVKRQQDISQFPKNTYNQESVLRIAGRKDMTHTVLFAFTLINTNQDRPTIIVRLQRNVYYIVIMQWLVR